MQHAYELSAEINGQIHPLSLKYKNKIAKEQLQHELKAKKQVNY